MRRNVLSLPAQPSSHPAKPRARGDGALTMRHFHCSSLGVAARQAAFVPPDPVTFHRGSAPWNCSRYQKSPASVFASRKNCNSQGIGSSQALETAAERIRRRRWAHAGVWEARKHDLRAQQIREVVEIVENC